MRKYESGPDAEILGSVLLSITEAGEFVEFSDLFAQVIAAYGVETIEPDGWYPRQMYFDLFIRILEETSGTTMNSLISIGLAVSHAVALPDDIDDSNLVEVLEVLNSAYRGMQQHLTAEDIGYEIEQISLTHIRVTDHTPYPHEAKHIPIYRIGRIWR
ncbi:MAG: hypothetical protein AAF125_08285, partial [Chloroflexota bacterium]